MILLFACIVVGGIAAYGLKKLDEAVERHLDGEDEDAGFYLLEGEQDQFH